MQSSHHLPELESLLPVDASSADDSTRIEITPTAEEEMRSLRKSFVDMNDRYTRRLYLLRFINSVIILTSATIAIIAIYIRARDNEISWGGNPILVNSYNNLNVPDDWRQPTRYLGICGVYYPLPNDNVCNYSSITPKHDGEIEDISFLGLQCRASAKYRCQSPQDFGVTFPQIEASYNAIILLAIIAILLSLINIALYIYHRCHIQKVTSNSMPTLFNKLNSKYKLNIQPESTFNEAINKLDDALDELLDRRAKRAAVHSLALPKYNLPAWLKFFKGSGIHAEIKPLISHVPKNIREDIFTKAGLLGP